ncbi:MAG: DNA repair protein RadA [Acidimicrobiia bacterium]|nr:DNA repair protein RadA [Acidimicrobiia bacterium]
MARNGQAAAARLGFRCAACGATSVRWTGRCSGCGAWNQVEEQRAPRLVAASPVGGARRITEVPADRSRARPTGLAELDRVLAGGLVAGSVTLVGGEPGVGKSTLLLQALASLVARGGRALYVTAEEAAHQVQARAARLGCLRPELWLAAETSLDAVVGHVLAVRPDVVVVDSVQAVHSSQHQAPPGAVTQVREVAHRLAEVAREENVAVVLVGHVTKDGSLAGPRQLEHLVDTVLAFDGDRHHALRRLRAVKHRYGPTHELGLFEMGEDGLVTVDDPSGLFLADRLVGVPGSVVLPLLEGRRPLLVELQALVSPPVSSSARRSAEGIDGGRLALVLAVLEQRAGVQVAGRDVLGVAVGGVRASEPAADLPLALAVASAALDVALPPGLVACGELGLGGEVRIVADLGRRAAEARRLGFDRVLVPASAPADVGAGVVGVRTLTEALAAAGLPAANVPKGSRP